MSQLSEKIFKKEKHYKTSDYGYRKDPITGKRTWHNGTDYATDGKKIPQYAIENGIITGCGTDSSKAKYVYVYYPRLARKLLHYHLDSISVKNGQNVDENTVLGITGRTGRATGIHLHLGLFDSKGKSYNPDTYKIPNIVTNTETYTVKSGDYLVKIGRKLGIKWQEIATINNIKSPYIIKVGQVLKLPIPTASDGPVTYTVVKGDYLIKVAKKVGVKWTTIAKLNRIRPPYLLKVGQILRIK